MKIFNVIIASLLLICFTRAVFGVEPLSLRTLLIELQSIDFGLDGLIYELQQLRNFSWDFRINNFLEFFKIFTQFADFLIGCVNAIAELVMVIVDTILSILYFSIRILGLPDIPLAPNT